MKSAPCLHNRSTGLVVPQHVVVLPLLETVFQETRSHTRQQHNVPNPAWKASRLEAGAHCSIANSGAVLISASHLKEDELPDFKTEAEDLVQGRERAEQRLLHSKWHLGLILGRIRPRGQIHPPRRKFDEYTMPIQR